MAWFIIVTTGSVLFPQGIEIESAADAARALAPFAGHYAEALFAIGLIAASFLAACVLPLTTAFVICEAFGWEAGVSFKWKAAPPFTSISTFAMIAFSAAVVLVPNIDLHGRDADRPVRGAERPAAPAVCCRCSWPSSPADKRVMGACISVAHRVARADLGLHYKVMGIEYRRMRAQRGAAAGEAGAARA